jgi:fructose-1,6-bisphosphatase II
MASNATVTRAQGPRKASIAEDTSLGRNLALELVRVTEAAAIRAARWVGSGDKVAADRAARDAVRDALKFVDMDGVTVLSEGEKDQAPMIAIHSHVGNGNGPEVDFAVDPIDGTTLTARGLPNAISVVAVAERGAMFTCPHVAYMRKIAVGPAAKGAIDINASVKHNLVRIARFSNKDMKDLTVVILDRERHQELIEEVRSAGARIKLISDGDVAGAVTAAMEDYPGVDVLMGTGGTPEAVLAACALKALGGDMQAKLVIRNEEERKSAIEAGMKNVDKVLTLDDLVQGDDAYFAATGITSGEFLQGVSFGQNTAQTQSVMMRSRSGTLRYINTRHNIGLKAHLPMGATYVPG